ncbi:MAG: hypothetical protein ACI9FN_002494 [Saprospiraceae bacterium]|jgi:hypothetical protein
MTQVSKVKSTVKLSHNVYVVELSKGVWTKSKKFRDANAHYKGIMGCLYVGMTSHSPLERFEKHKSGYRTKKGIKISSYFVEKYGLYLRPSLYKNLNPLTKDKATYIEGALAKRLRRQGFAVWWN